MTGPSIRSLLAVRGEGFLSAGVIVGAATYQVMQPMGCRATWGLSRKTGAALLQRLEYSSYVDGVTRTWRDAIDRLEAEALAAGAHGVVGVSARTESIHQQQGGFQVQLIGSGVVVPGVQPLQRPFLSMLSLPDTVKLLLRGWIPTGIGVGVAALHVHGLYTGGFGQRGAFVSNTEMEVPTATVNAARRDAELRLRKCSTLGAAHVVVGAKIDVDMSSDMCFAGQGMKMLVQMTGTGVVQFGAPTVPVETSYPLTGTREKAPVG